MEKKNWVREKDNFFCIGKNMHRIEETGKFIIRGWDKKRQNKGRYKGKIIFKFKTAQEECT